MMAADEQRQPKLCACDCGREVPPGPSGTVTKYATAACAHDHRKLKQKIARVLGPQPLAPKLCACGCGAEVVSPIAATKYATEGCKKLAAEQRGPAPDNFKPWEPTLDTSKTSQPAPPPPPPLSSFPNTDQGRWDRFWCSVTHLKGWAKRHPNVKLPRKETDPL